MCVDLVTVSSEGQVALPMNMINALSLTSGDKLAVYATNDFIVLKPVRLPDALEFSKWLDEANEWAASAGYKEDDVNEIIKSVRKNKRR